jgi:Cysteine dioxygenase type I
MVELMGTNAFEAPTVRLAWLAEMTRSLARDVRTGIYGPAGFNAGRRWHRRIYRDQHVDLWLIGWLPTQGTRLHDHGGSSGAFTVASGSLSEATYDPDTESTGLRERVVGDGASIEFDGEYVHDVRNLSQASAVSVHAYSPPLARMRFYAVRDGRLAMVGTLDTDDPEPVIRHGLAG